MIKDYDNIKNITKECICFSCRKKVYPGKQQFYEIALKSNYQVTSCSKNMFGQFANVTGTGSVLRFHIECFKDIAGEEYMFDTEIWK